MAVCARIALQPMWVYWVNITHIDNCRKHW